MSGNGKVKGSGQRVRDKPEKSKRKGKEMGEE